MTISESGANVIFGGYRWDRGVAMSGQNAVQLVAGQPDAGEALSLGQIAVSASVSVTFEMKWTGGTKAIAAAARTTGTVVLPVTDHWANRDSYPAGNRPDRAVLQPVLS